MKLYTVTYVRDPQRREEPCSERTKVCYGWSQYRRLIKTLRRDPQINEIRIIK